MRRRTELQCDHSRRLRQAVSLMEVLCILVVLTSYLGSVFCGPGLLGTQIDVQTMRQLRSSHVCRPAASEAISEFIDLPELPSSELHVPPPPVFMFAVRANDPSPDSDALSPFAKNPGDAANTNMASSLVLLLQSVQKPASTEEVQTLRSAADLALAKRRTNGEVEIQREKLRDVAAVVAMQAERGDLEAEDLSSSIYSISLLRKQCPELQLELPLLTDGLLGRAMDLQASGVSETLWSVAELRREAALLQCMLPVLVERLARTASAMNVKELLMSLWSLAVLRLELENAGLHMTPLLAFLIDRVSTQEDFSTLSMTDIADALWSLSIHMKILPKKQFKVVATRMVDEIHSRAQELTAYTTYSILYSSVLLQESSVASQLDLLLPTLREASRRTMASMSQKELSATLWAFATLSSNQAEIMELFRQMRVEIGYAIAGMSLPDMSIAVWALAAVNFKDQELMEMVVDNFLATEEMVRTPFMAKSLPRIVWALSRLGFYHSRMMEAVAKRLKPSTLILRHFGPGHLHALLWAFNRYDPDKQRFKDTHIALEAKVKVWIKMRYTHGLTEEGKHAVAGRLVPYLQIPDDIPVPDRCAAMLEQAIALGASGPDERSDRKSVSQRPRESAQMWVREDDRFLPGLYNAPYRYLEARRESPKASLLPEPVES